MSSAVLFKTEVDGSDGFSYSLDLRSEAIAKEAFGIFMVRHDGFQINCAAVIELNLRTENGGVVKIFFFFLELAVL